MKLIRFSLLLVFGFIVCFGFSVVKAQDDSSIESKGVKLPVEILEKLRSMNVSPELVVNEMKNEIGINDAQAEQILPVITAQMDDLKATLDKLSSGDEVSLQDLTRVQTAMMRTNTALTKILTPEQLLKWNAAMVKGQAKAQEMLAQQ